MNFMHLRAKILKVITVVVVSTAFCAQLSSVSYAQSNTRERVRSSIARFIKRYWVDPRVKDHSYQSVILSEKGTGRTIEVNLGKKLGNGFSGTVYTIQSISGSDILGKLDVQSLVLKTANRTSRCSDALLKSTRSEKPLRNEASQYQAVANQQNLIWSDPRMHHLESRYERGSLPIAQIFEAVDSVSGMFLFKTKLIGEDMGELFRKYGDKKENIPDEIWEGLRDVYDFAQIVHKHVKMPSNRIPGREFGYSADLKPENLMWIQNPEALKLYGLKKPGFIFVEFTHYDAPIWIYDQNSLPFSDYQEVFLKYLKFNGSR